MLAPTNQRCTRPFNAEGTICIIENLQSPITHLFGWRGNFASHGKCGRRALQNALL